MAQSCCPIIFLNLASISQIASISETKNGRLQESSVSDSSIMAHSYAGLAISVLILATLPKDLKLILVKLGDWEKTDDAR